jgi:methionyl-tRNA formyltransferase
MRQALHALVPALAAGTYDLFPQDDGTATYFGRRTPEDGRIAWAASAESIHALIRASTRPHPGAFTFWKDRKLIIWLSKRDIHHRMRGVVGRILEKGAGGEVLVQTGDGLLWLLEYEVEGQPAPVLRVGELMGYDVELELYRLKKKLQQLGM